MLLTHLFENKVTLSEGGNIFKGDLATQRINRADVIPTVAWLEKITGLPLQDGMLGTTGRKDTSGDLDLAVDNRSITKDQLVAKLAEVAKKMGIEPKDVIKKSGISVHFRTPISGDPKKGHVQADFMFTDDPEWTKFAAAASGTSQYKGSHKHVVMSSIAKAMGLKWSPTLGLLTRDTGKLLSKNPDDIAEILLGKGHDRSSLESVETLLDALKNDPERDEKLMDARETLARENVKLPESATADQVKGTEKARTVKLRPFAGSQPHPFQGKLVGGEAVENPTDRITMDIPLFIRMMEYAREDAKDDMDLHDVAEKAIQLMQDHDYLCMDNYDELVNDNAANVNEADDLMIRLKKEAGFKHLSSAADKFIRGLYYEMKHNGLNPNASSTRKLVYDNIVKQWNYYEKLLNKTNEAKKPKPTNPELWSRAKAAARSKFEVYPSAYANAWAAKWYKSKGGGWRMGK